MKMIFIFTLSCGLCGVAHADDEADDEIEEIVVTGTRSARALGDSPVATKVLTADDIRASGAEDVGDLLEQVPGIDVQRNFLGAAVRLQGLDPEHVLVLVDGQRMTGRAGGAIDLSRIPVDSIERIEIVEGAGSALYGSDAMGGVIHIVTRDPQSELRGHVRGRGGQLGMVDVAGGAEGGSSELQARLDGGLHRQSPYDRDPSTPQTTASGVMQGQVSGRIDADPSPDWLLSAVGSYNRLDSQGVDAAASGAQFDRRNLQEEVRASVQPRFNATENTLLSAHLGWSFFRDQYASDQVGSDALDAYADTRDQLLQASAQLEQVAGMHHLMVGGDALAEWLTSERLTEGIGQRQRGGLFVQDEWRAARTLRILPSARVDGDTSFGWVPTARLALRYDPHPRVVSRLSAGTGYRAPSFREQLLLFENPGSGYRIDGNPALRPENSRQLNGGVELTPVDGFTLLVSGFFNDVDDLITVQTVAEQPGLTRFGYANVSRARTAGGEATVDLDLSSLLSLGGSYTYTDARDLTLDRELEGRSRHRGTADVRLNVESTDTELSARAGFVGSRSFYSDPDDPNASVERPPGYALVDVRVEQGLGRAVAAFVGGDNLLDAGDTLLLPTLPRLFYAGLRAELTRRSGKSGAPPRGVP
jgi:outer membrane receptor for ferrienterochelin and colicins